MFLIYYPPGRTFHQNLTIHDFPFIFFEIFELEEERIVYIW